MRYSEEVAAILLILVLLVTFAGYATEPTIGGDLSFATSSPVQTLDPHLALDENSIEASKTIYQPLVKYSTIEAPISEARLIGDITL